MAEVEAAGFPGRLDVDSMEDVDDSLPTLAPRISRTLQPVIAIDPVALITTECVTVTSAMRKNPRFSQSSRSAILGGGAGRSQEKEILRSASQRAMKARTPSIPDPTSRSATPLGRNSVDEDDVSLASRWGLRGRKGKSTSDSPLLTAFARLRRDLAGCKDVGSFDAPELLNPFLQVIRSSSTSAAITSLAVTSITRFFAYDLITMRSPRVALAMHLIAAAITHCRFEASDTQADEVVLLRILRLMENVMTRAEGQLLGDESICEMMSTGLSMCCQTRLSEVLRRSAEMTMVTMCQVVFGRLKDMDVEMPPAKMRSRTATLASIAPVEEDLKIVPSMSGSVMGNGVVDGRSSVEEPARQSVEALPTNASKESLLDHQKAVEVNGDLVREAKPYGLPSIKELFRVLIDLLDQHNKSHTDAMRIMGLRVIDVALEVAGPAIATQPVLAQLVQDSLSKHVLQLVKSDNMFLLSSSLRVAGTLLSTCRQLLKLQQELFLSYMVACLHPKVEIPVKPNIDPSLYDGIPQPPKLSKPAPSQPSSGRSTPVPVKDRQQLGLEGGARRPEVREAMIESVGSLIRLPSFMSELFINYDCEVDRQDLCEDMVGLLSRSALPDSADWSTHNVPPLCLDSLLNHVQFMADRLDQPVPEEAAGRIKQFRYQRMRKKVIKSGAAKFNDDPKGGIAYLVKNGIIKDPDDPLQVAQFLKSTNHLSKKVLGEFITKKQNEALLTSFINLFQFDDKRIDEAFRDLISTFRLPGESALIERIITTFTENYCATAGTDDIADKDSAFVLSYAIIMLNTDMYNPNNKQKRMQSEDFARNLRGVNGGKDFDPDFLQEIYDAIKKNELILPDEHDNQHAFEYAWKELLMKTQDAGDLELCQTNAFDAEMFRATWKPIVATLNYVFMSASDDAVFSRVVVGYDQCAQIAAKYNIPEVFDRIVYSLCQMTGLAPEIPPNTTLNTEVQAGQRKIMVSELAVRLGRDFKSQLSTVLLFRILSGHEQAVGETWLYVVRILRNLFINSLIPLPPPDHDRVSKLDPIPLRPVNQVISRDGRLADSGLFSTFTSYLSSYAADDPPEPSEEELENTLSAVDCIKACTPAAIMRNMYNIPSPQTSSLVRALLSQLDDSSPVVTVKPERPMPVTARVNGHRSNKSGPEYDPGTMFMLELATGLTLRDPDTVAASGERLTNALQNVIRDPASLHPLASSRIVRYTLDLLRSSFTHDFMRPPVVLHALSSFSDDVLSHTAAAVIAGLASCLTEPGPLRNEITNSPDFWSILQRLHQHKQEAGSVFEILSMIASASPPAVTADNYEATVSLANDYAADGSIGAVPQRPSTPAGRRPPQKQQAKPQQKKEKPEDNVVVQRALKAIALVYNMTSLTPLLIDQSHLEHNEAWAAYWSPIFRSLCAQSVNPCREIRHRAMSALQRVLLSEDLAKSSSTHPADARKLSAGSVHAEEDDKPDNEEWTAIFTEVLFPLILRLLKPEIYQLDPIGMSDTRVQAATLLCKIYLRYLDHLAALPPLHIQVPARQTTVAADDDEKGGDNATPPIQQTTIERSWLLDVWTKILSLLDRMMNSGVATREQEIMSEAVVEGVKNCLLVMAGSGHLDSETREGDLWKETERRVEKVSPGLMDELFPVPEPEPVAKAEEEAASKSETDDARLVSDTDGKT